MQKIPFEASTLVPVAVRQLAAAMAHEVWNPLTVIKTMVFAMGADILPDDPRRADFNVVNGEIDRMERSIRQFLDYTWPPDPVLAPVRLDQVVAHTVDRLGPKARAQGVQIETSQFLDVEILADRMQIEQVFVNLGLNALRAMPAGGKLSVVARTEQVIVNLALSAVPVAVEGATSRAAEDKGTAGVGVEVADTGAGIPQDLLDRVFEPFAIEGGEGVGLGLAIAQQIVARHGGQVAAHNRPEGGSTFTVTLPLALDAGTASSA